MALKLIFLHTVKLDQEKHTLWYIYNIARTLTIIDLRSLFTQQNGLLNIYKYFRDLCRKMF